MLTMQKTATTPKWMPEIPKTSYSSCLLYKQILLVHSAF
jgi:hypothetical protein